MRTASHVQNHDVDGYDPSDSGEVCRPLGVDVLDYVSIRCEAEGESRMVMRPTAAGNRKNIYVLMLIGLVASYVQQYGGALMTVGILLLAACFVAVMWSGLSAKVVVDCRAGVFRARSGYAGWREYRLSSVVSVQILARAVAGATSGDGAKGHELNVVFKDPCVRVNIEAHTDLDTMIDHARRLSRFMGVSIMTS